MACICCIVPNHVLDRLAADYRVSRATAQKALTVLVDEGLVETRRRWGSFVAER